jgi:Fe-S cluster assembly protein SufB
MHNEPAGAVRAFRFSHTPLKTNAMAYTEEELKKELETKEYAYGFYTDIESETFPIGLDEEIVRAISEKKEEPEWMTAWRLEAFKQWQKDERT